MIGRRLPLVLATATALLATGCGSRTNIPAAQTDTGQPANFQLVTDIPIPSGATMDNERSLILSDRDHWDGRVVMRFWQSQPELTVFYQNQMPAFGWDPVMSVTSDISVLSYIRGDRAATVQIEKSMLGMTSVVSVTVAPRQVSAPAATGTAGGDGYGAGGQTGYGGASGQTNYSGGSPTNYGSGGQTGYGGGGSYDAGAANRQPVKTETLSSPNRQ